MLGFKRGIHAGSGYCHIFNYTQLHLWFSTFDVLWPLLETFNTSGSLRGYKILSVPMTNRLNTKKKSLHHNSKEFFPEFPLKTKKKVFTSFSEEFSQNFHGSLGKEIFLSNVPRPVLNVTWPRLRTTGLRCNSSKPEGLEPL